MRDRRSCEPSVLLLGPTVGGVRRHEVERPAEQPCREDREPGRDDQPEDAPQEVAIVDLADARDDEREDGGQARIAEGG